MNESVELSLEQQFQLRSFNVQVSTMTEEQAKKLLLEMYSDLMIREALYKKLIKHEWGLADEPRI